MAGPDRARLPRDSLGLGLSEMLQAQATCPFDPCTRVNAGRGMGMGSNASGASITKLLRVSATTSIEPRRGGPSSASQGLTTPGEPQEPLEANQPRVTMSDILGEAEVVVLKVTKARREGPSVSMGECSAEQDHNPFTTIWAAT